ncbi:MAG: RidA family protein [Chloroflexota bacterium]|nr:RidA family protein [Chloroflexota bacterium]MED5429545.1 RidA family protein [Chloroflexota bacterium]MED5450586.1 RidA family protein [Chloroflexota bacterium]|tara:strand:+ start:629 stop:1021 length:393 start_codon:yes stop_codon:yes gene_type:complete
MGLEFINPDNAPAPAANYSNLAIVPPGYRLLVIAGQIGNLADGSIVEGLEAQYEQAISNIKSIVASEGGDSTNIARITVFLAGKPSQRELIGAAMQRNFPSGPPAMSWVYVSELFSPEVKVEIEAIAAVP